VVISASKDRGTFTFKAETTPPKQHIFKIDLSSYKVKQQRCFKTLDRIPQAFSSNLNYEYNEATTHRPDVSINKS